MREQSQAVGPRSASDLRAIPMFAGCGEETLARMFSALATSRYRARAMVVVNHAAEHARVAFVWSGRLRLSRVSPGGVTVTLYTAEPGSAIGLPAALLGFVGVGARITCDTAATIIDLPATELMAAASECPALARGIMTALAGLSIDYAARIYELAALDVRARLVAELLRVARRGVWKDGSLFVADALTQAALGGQISASREAVTRHLRDLGDEGLIVFKRGSIEFPDLRRLQALDKTEAGRTLWSGAGPLQNGLDAERAQDQPHAQDEQDEQAKQND